MLENLKEIQGNARAYLVGIAIKAPGSATETEPRASLEELAELVHNLGVEVVGSHLAIIQSYNAAFLVGTGKAEAIIEEAKALGATALVFDEPITASQQRNWEKASKLTILDRHEVILDIFAQRAQTKEAVLQVELAAQEYFLPRLKRAWTHLNRQRGGGAMQRSEGETQLEVDRRIIKRRIATLKEALKDVVEQRATQRKQRRKVPIPSASIVGYTNAGKSTLLNTLTDAGVLEADKLFATLDPTTRRLVLPHGQTLLLTDTVGFIRKLPHKLIDAFKATLEEALFADFIIQLVDVSNPDFKQTMDTTNQVLKELGAESKEKLLVFNKIDALEQIQRAPLRALYPEALMISLKTGEGIPELLAKLESFLEEDTKLVKLVIPHDQYKVMAELHALGGIEKTQYEDDGAHVLAKIPKRSLEHFKRYIL